MRAFARIATAVTAGLAALLAVAPAAGATTQTESVSIKATTINLGGVDLLSYCKAIGYVNVKNTGGSAADWRCIASDGSEHTMSVEDACNWQFLNLLIDGITVYPVNQGGEGGWRCYSNPLRAVQLGGMDLAKYCQSIGYSTAVLTERNVAGWRCQSSSGAQAAIDLHASCRFANPALTKAGWSLAATFGSVGDAYGIKCAALRNS